MTLTIYGAPISPPFRSVVLTAKLLGVPYTIKEINLIKGEHLTPEFLKLNPLHTVPVIDDDGFILFESNAIVTYLIDKYGEEDTLYPKDLQRRAIIDQRLHFNGNNLFARFLQVVPFVKAKKEVPEDIMKRIDDSLAFLEALLGYSDWVAQTPNFTIADVCLLSSLENVNMVFPDIVKPHSKLTSWLQRGRSAIPDFEEFTKPALEKLRELLGDEIAKNRDKSTF